MKQRKVCGFDLNGWRDFTAKNWRTIPGDEEEIGPVDVVESGPMTSVVLVGDGSSARWVGGPQADLAPHGRGGGWGEVGREERRVAVHSLLSMRDKSLEKLAAAFEGSARGAAYNVVSIDDRPNLTELTREHLLQALSRARYRSPMLVWRPVLVALRAIELDLIKDEQRVGVICHDNQGLTVQKLLIRRAGRDDALFVPERREGAVLVESDIGYEGIVKRTRLAAIGSDGLSQRTEHRARAKTVGRRALGLRSGSELIRLNNGDWEVLDLSSFDPVVSSNREIPMLDMSDCAVVLAETLTSGVVREAVIARVQDATAANVLAMDEDTVARGALFAAQRMADGDPVFFDFLPKISTIVFGREGTINFDLIDASETLEAGRLYRSPKPAQFAIPADQPSISIYLRKETEQFPRLANVELEQPLKSPVPVSLWVEQKPAAERARIVLESRDLGRQFSIDFNDAEEVRKSWEDIIKSLETPPPTYPDRLVLKCGMHAWEETTRLEGLFSLLEAQVSKSVVNWDALASKLSARPFGEYCISSDGEIPGSVPAASVRSLDMLTERALQETRARLTPGVANVRADNSALKFLTWQFHRCPQVVVDWLVECIESRELPIFEHPFVSSAAGWVLVFQGLGRIASNGETERRIIRLLMSTKVAQWGWRTESACMAFLLSRSDTAPKHLSRGDVEKLAKRAAADFKTNLGTEYTKFYYAPFLAAGLLRWRIQEPMALLLGQDPIASELFEAISAAEKDLARRRLRGNDGFARRIEKYLPILKELKTFLEGDEGNPDLLLDIYGNGE